MRIAQASDDGQAGCCRGMNDKCVGGVYLLKYLGLPEMNRCECEVVSLSKHNTSHMQNHHLELNRQTIPDNQRFRFPVTASVAVATSA